MDLKFARKFNVKLAADRRQAAPIDRLLWRYFSPRDISPQIYGYAAMKFYTRRYIARMYFMPQGASCACDVARR